MKKQWVLHNEDKLLQKKISERLKISNITSQILINRGFKDIETIEKFINTTLSKLSFPLLMKDIEKACDRIVFAIKKSERILIYGDYDVDGVTSVALLINFLKLIGYYNFRYYIPERLNEGYGLNINAIKNFKDDNVKLIITVDCGVSDTEKITYAKSIGIDTIVTDHHEISDTLPEDAFALINPKQKDCNFPFKEMAGVGIAFYLIAGLKMKLKDTNFSKNIENYDLKQFLSFVALGTVADICPLQNENRVFVKYGLSELEHTNNPGLKALKQICNIREGQLSYWTVGYRLAPRINAIGRLGKADIAVELLTTNDYSNALKLASLLERTNYERQKIEETTLNNAIKMIESSKYFNNKKSIVLYSDTWHEGVIGIVASRLVEKYNKPAVLISFTNEIGKGSGRSIKDFDLFQSLNLCSEYLIDFGGHKYAAGLSIHKNQLSKFIEAFESIASKISINKDNYKNLYIDKKIAFSELDTALMDEFSLLEPFGNANSEPILLSEDVLVTSVKIFGTNHIKLILEQCNKKFEAIAFNQVNKDITMGDSLHVSYSPFSYKENTKVNIKLKIKDLIKI